MSPKHGLNPVDASVSIRPADCESCLYVPDLVVWREYFFRARSHNARGYSPYVLNKGTPKEIPNAPNGVSANSISGNTIDIFFSPPSGEAIGIFEYVIQYDIDQDLTNLLNVAVGSRSCGTRDWGECRVTGTPLTLNPPYVYRLNGLTATREYFVRVSAKNAISLISAASFTRWSTVISRVAANQPPSAPASVTTLASGPNHIQVLISPPRENGGLSISDYIIEWSTSAKFDTNVQSVTVSSARDKNDKFMALKTNDATVTTKLYNIDQLTSRTPYFVRVAAKNSIAVGPYANAPSSAIPDGKPGSPASVSLSLPQTSATTITSATIAWTSPVSSTSPVSQYLVEWWEDAKVSEVQVITYRSNSYPSFSPNGFRVTYSSSSSVREQSGVLKDSTTDFNMRSELLNLGSGNYVVGDVRVTKQTIPGRGYTWSITFMSDQNSGDIPQLQVALAGQTGEEVFVNTVTNGQRSQGFSEVQQVSIYAQNSNSALDQTLEGTFKLQFGTSQVSANIRAEATADEVKRAIEAFPTVRTVSVTRNRATPLINGLRYVGFDWLITFIGVVNDKADMPAIQLFPSMLSYNGTTASIFTAVYDGDNKVAVAPLTSSAAAGFKIADTYPGEKPFGYNYKWVDAGVSSFVIDSLVPGKSYYASVAAVNTFGTGPARAAAPSSILPPKQIPQQPRNFQITPTSSSQTSFDASYSAPLSDGGAPVLYYRVEFDTSDDFKNPIAETVYCPASSKHTVYSITTQSNVGLGITATVTHGATSFTTSASVASTIAVGDKIQFPNIQLNANDIYTVSAVVGSTVTLLTAVQLSLTNRAAPVAGVFIIKNNPIVSGGFTLRLTKSGRLFETAIIPYNAPATLQDEVGVVKPLVGVTATVTHLQTTFTASVDSTFKIFPGDRIKFPAIQLNDNDVYTVVSVTGATVSFGTTTIRLKPQYQGAAQANEVIGRYYGGRSASTCTLDSLICPSLTVGNRGSMQGKFESIPDALQLGVKVDRDEADSNNGFTWRVTFLDPSPAGNDNFFVDVGAVTVLRSNGVAASVIVTKLMDGIVYGDCTNPKTIPSSRALATGQLYYSRIFAANEIGIGLSLNGNRQKPQGVPGLVTLVTLASDPHTSTGLVVAFSPPAVDGGDSVSLYRIEYSTSVDFVPSLTSSTDFTAIQGGAPYQKTINGLLNGVDYFVRVSAKNSRGYSIPTISAPSSMHPCRAPDGPSGVMLYATSDSMLTVSFAPPLSNGGDPVVRYRIEWDTQPNFQGTIPTPNKGFFDVSALLHNSYTITGLTKEQVYYVRVYAENKVGQGVSTMATPGFANPAFTIAGKPHTVLAVTGDIVGSVDVSWQYPRIPWHGVPCSGTIASPNDCPIPSGGILASSTGGLPITEYEVSYSENLDFTGFGGNFITADNRFTVTGLTPGRLYYIRVLARNSQGSGKYCGHSDRNCLVLTTPVSATAKALVA